MNCGNTGTHSKGMKGTKVSRKKASSGGSKQMSSQQLGKMSSKKTMKGY